MDFQRHGTTVSEKGINRRKEFWARLKGKTRTEVPGVMESLKAFVRSSWLNTFLVFIPIAWVAHFQEGWSPNIAFSLCFLSIIPLESLFDYGGEQMALYCGQDLGDLIVVTLNNAVEATLAIILLTKCELKLLQSTIAGVVLLHLLLIPGVAFLAGGARVWEQDLHPHATQLNHALLAIGVLSLLIPAAFFSALNPGVAQVVATAASVTDSFLTDALRDELLKISRGMGVILLIVYISSRIFLFDPPGEGNTLATHPNAPEAVVKREAMLAEKKPSVNPWVCVIVLVITVGIMAATAEFLVDSIESVREGSQISREWFGIILLPILSFSGDATVAIVYFLKSLYKRQETPESLAKGRAIDLSIQFTLFWMPFLVLLGWWTNKPLTLLFDLFEVSLLIGACFLVNYVTADAKTNWAEGVMLCAFYVMIALVSWFYTGQPAIEELLVCGNVVGDLSNIAGEA
ncbi:hypothetical protein BU17DRAFT_35676 [Hysterangium stoloniferum]|nr:hypothetical protein BU17DRAFT_35676 [Hysterangium stoloniferum]